MILSDDGYFDSFSFLYMFYFLMYMLHMALNDSLYIFVFLIFLVRLFRQDK